MGFLYLNNDGAELARSGIFADYPAVSHGIAISAPWEMWDFVSGSRLNPVTGSHTVRMRKDPATGKFCLTKSDATDKEKK